MKKNYQYKYFGLGISSDTSLQLLDETRFVSKPDLTLSYDPTLTINDEKKIFVSNLNDSLLNYPNIGVINIKSNGKKLFYNCHELNLNFLSKIINHGIGYSYYQRKKLALHGSAIRANKKAILFLGESGSGKSSLIASLSKKFQIVSDDTIGVENFKKYSYVYPGLSYFKIDSSMAKKIKVTNKKISLNDDRQRSYYRAEDNISSKIPLEKCYILRWGKDDIIEEIKNPKDKLAAFLQSTYTCFPLNSCIKSAATLMEQSSSFFNNVKIYSFVRKKGNILSNANMVIDHIHNEKYQRI